MSITLRPHQQEAYDKLASASRGQVIVPTGGGKTLIAISDAVRRMEQNSTPITIVVVAPRILLANQLCEEFMEVIQESTCFAVPAHVHSGETHHFSSTKVEQIQLYRNMCETAGLHSIIFTTYHSLHRVAEAGIPVDTIYFDEAHNSTRRDFFPATKYFSEVATRAYFFTATPKHSAVTHKAGMNDNSVYGNVIVSVPAPALVEGGFIVPPKVALKELPMVDGRGDTETDKFHLLSSIQEYSVDKVLVCAKSVKQIVNLFANTNFAQQLEDMGYSHMYISAKTGGVIDGKKVSREEFFLTLNAWGKDNNKKFVVLHHSILAEGINVSGLEAVVFMRSMDMITISQTIGRVIRLHKDDAAGMREGSITPGDLGSYTKSFGLCIIPTFSKATKKGADSIQRVVDTIFAKGEAAVGVVRR